MCILCSVTRFSNDFEEEDFWDKSFGITLSNDLILISYSGETNYIIDVAEILKNMQTPIIAITSIADNNLSKLADVTLRISSREMLLTKIGDFATTASIKYILDTLYAGIFSFDYQKNLDYKIQIAKLVDDRHSGYEFIDEDE